MNERIKELAKQAGFETNEALCSFGNYKIDNEYFFAEDFIEDELARFAELIIRACATKANATALDIRIRPELDARKYVGDGILKCFGVEE